MALTPGGLSGAMREQRPDSWWPSSERYNWHQPYLFDVKNPHGYCPDHGTGVSCPIGVVKADG